MSLTIKLDGDNNTVSGSIGIYVLSDTQTGPEASLTINGGSSLTVSATSSTESGIRVQSNNNNATLTIEGAAVEAIGGNYTGSAGVQVQSSASSNASLTVDGGSLTASGNTGIRYSLGSSDSGSGTPSLTVSGNAVVDANGGISNNSTVDFEVGADSSSSDGGIVFNDGDGNVTLQEDLTTGENESLTLDGNAHLDANGHNVIVDGGTLDKTLAESLGTSAIYIYKVTGVTLDKTSLTLNKDDTTTLTATITPDNATDKTVTWESSDDNVATVENGTVTAVGAGTAIITVTANNGSGKFDTCAVTVHAHSYGDWVSNSDGTHTHICPFDGNSETASCSDGTATCRSPATCTVCGTAYGSKDSGNHAGGTEIRGRSSGYTGDTYCLGYGVKLQTDTTIGGGSTGGYTPPKPRNQPKTGSSGGCMRYRTSWPALWTLSTAARPNRARLSPWR